MPSIDAIDLTTRFIALAVLGSIVGGFCNYAIYGWAYFHRPISPWAPPHPDAAPRRWCDRLPIIGWLSLRRESPLHGPAFWIRPVLIELGCCIGFPLMYWYYTQSGGLLPPEYRTAARLEYFSPWAHALFVVHGVLLTLMIVATFIDFDEQTIPDLITLPGTLLALVFACLPWHSFLPAAVRWGDLAGISETSFNVPWPYDDGWSGRSGLWLALAIWAAWIFAMADRRLILRHGLRRAIGYFCHGIRRRRSSKWLLAMGLVGSGGVIAVWWLGGDSWRGLLSSLIGLAVGGGTVWAVRIVASLAMGQEAMGFGDVTLMAMIGAFVGWQAAIAGFFLAPIAAILIVLIQYAVTRQPAVPFGPYLCAGTVIAVSAWNAVWNDTLSLYAEMGSLVLVILLAALLAMGAMLTIWGRIKRALFAPH